MIIVTGYTGFIGKNYIKKSALAKNFTYQEKFK